MNFRSNCFLLCASFFLSDFAYAQEVGTGVPPLMAAGNETRSFARMEVSFSGSHTQRFVFQEAPGTNVEQRMGVGMRTVGAGAIEMGKRKTVVHVQREDAKPDVFHGHFEIAGGGKLAAVMFLKVGEEHTVKLIGGKPTQVTVKRLR